jgi:hypothetical protein
MNADMLSMLLVFLGLMALLGTIGKIVLTFINRRRAVAPSSSISLDEIARQIAALQQTVDTTAIEVERLGEAQRFTTKLLAGRAEPAHARLEPPDSTAAR